MIIYKATNLVNGKCYIGQTIRSLDERVGEHKRKKKMLMYYVIKKYGAENVKFEIIDTAETIEELNEKEMFWIKHYNSVEPNGYNLCDGGGNTAGYHHRDEAKVAMSLKKKEAYVGEGNPFYGKRHSEEARKKMSEAKKGRPLTDEWREKVCAKVKRVKVENVETGEIFNSTKEAAEKYCVAATHITRVCRGKRKTCGGYHWRYVQNT